jgi:uncharacterized protein with LGFP repeats
MRALARLVTVATLVLAGALAPIAGPAPASVADAADLRFFDPGNIIADAVFYDSLSMDANAIQSFLTSKGSNCQDGAAPCLKNYRQDTAGRAATTLCAAYPGANGESAATIIAKVSMACGISPRVLLVLLEKEQGLVRASSPTSRKYEIAMGFGCPDTAACDSLYYGFFNQVYNAAAQYQRYRKNPNGYGYVAGRNNTIPWHPNASCGTSTVYIANQATAGLYNYTPYRPNQAALNAGYGIGDACSSYGNRNFWQYFTDWFGSTQSQGGAAIYAKYQEPGVTNALGTPTTAFFCGLRNGGCYQLFQNGKVLWSPATGAHAVVGMLAAGYDARGSENGGLGYPTSDTTCGLSGGGCYQWFQGGSLYGSASTPVQRVFGGVRERWLAWGLENGPLGYPTSDEQGGLVRGGTYQAFQNGKVYWSPGAGAHAMVGMIRDGYDARGAENGGVGYPTSDTTCGLRDGGCYQFFEGGTLYGSASTPVRWVFGGIREKWNAWGLENGPLGYPVGDEQAAAGGGRVQAFQTGTIHWSPATGARVVMGMMQAAYTARGGAGGGLGYPTSDTTCGLRDGGCYQLFQGGRLYGSASTPVQRVFGGIREKWDAWGLEAGPLGYPVNDEIGGLVRGGSYQLFQNGAIYWSTVAGAHVVTGQIRDAWFGHGAENGQLGYPLEDPRTVGGTTVQRFEGGTLTYDSATGVVTTS